MKTLKRAEQKNVIIDNEFYTSEELRELFKRGLTWYFEKTGIYEITVRNSDNMDTNNIYWWEIQKIEFRLGLHHVKELKVTYNKEYGVYTNVAVLLTGEEIYIKL